MKKTIKMIVIMAIVTMIIGISNISKSFSFNANLSSDNKLVAGQEVKVTLSLSGIDMDDGIRSIGVSKITVGDEFEPISTTSFSSNAFAPTYLNGGLNLISGNPVKDGVAAVTLTLKVKAETTAKSATVKFENIVASSGLKTGDISVGTKTVTIKANEPAQSGDEPGTTNPSTPDGTQNNPNKNEQKPTNNNSTNKISSLDKTPDRLPKAGYANIKTIIIPAVLLLIIAGVVSLIKYKK